MSFADDLRAELVGLTVKKNCCRRALCAGLLMGAEHTEDGAVLLCCRYECVALLAAEALEKQYAKRPTVTVKASHGHRTWTVCLSSSTAGKLASRLQAARDNSLDELLHLSDCEGCRSAFLRGLFFLFGTVNHPQKSSHLELCCPNENIAVTVSAFLEGIGYPPKRIARKNGIGLYYKDGNQVSDLVTLMGAHSIIFEFYNARIAGDIRNNENRATNCVARNIEKSVSAAARQMEAIEMLMQRGKLDALSDPLKDTALLRYRNPDATLDELKELHNPPISKSGLNHRLQKLMDAAEQSKEII